MHLTPYVFEGEEIEKASNKHGEIFQWPFALLCLQSCANILDVLALKIFLFIFIISAKHSSLCRKKTNHHLEVLRVHRNKNHKEIYDL